MDYPEVGGHIKHLKLQQWWFKELTQKERNSINTRCSSIDGSNYDHGNIQYSSLDVTQFYISIIGQLMVGKDFLLADKVADYAVKLSHKSAFSSHLLRGRRVDIKFKLFGNSNPTIEAALFQCEIGKEAILDLRQSMQNGVVSHVGYKRLAIAYFKAKRYTDCIDICRQADLEGWAGDWGKRIERCTKKKSI